jgi:hypothetical protein
MQFVCFGEWYFALDKVRAFGDTQNWILSVIGSQNWVLSLSFSWANKISSKLFSYLIEFSAHKTDRIRELYISLNVIVLREKRIQTQVTMALSWILSHYILKTMCNAGIINNRCFKSSKQSFWKKFSQPRTWHNCINIREIKAQNIPRKQISIIGLTEVVLREKFVIKKKLSVLDIVVSWWNCLAITVSKWGLWLRFIYSFSSYLPKQETKQEQERKIIYFTLLDKKAEKFWLAWKGVLSNAPVLPPSIQTRVTVWVHFLLYVFDFMRSF